MNQQAVVGFLILGFLFICVVELIFQSASSTVIPLSENHFLSELPPTSSTHRLQKGESGRHAIFYNVFFGDDRVVQALRITKEQFSQIRESHFSNATIFYNAIGSNQTICPSDMDCRFLNFYPKANEEVTLQALFEHCLENPHNRVSYMHNKGSFSKYQMAFLRRHATRAALSSDKCASPCNVCGAVFQTTPYFHYSSNMWTAECSYIQKLVPPVQYELKRRGLCRSDMLQGQVQGDDHLICPDVQMPIDNDPGLLARYGFGRYAAERWIVSHPSLVPCQFFPGNFGNCQTCDLEAKLIVAKRRRSKFAIHHWRTLSHQLAEYEYMYGVLAQEAAGMNSSFCQSYFLGHARNPCTFNKDVFNESVQHVLLSDVTI